MSESSHTIRPEDNTSVPFRYSATGYQCQCGMWVYPGMTHSCRPYAYRNYAGERQQYNMERIATALERIANQLEARSFEAPPPVPPEDREPKDDTD